MTIVVLKAFNNRGIVISSQIPQEVCRQLRSDQPPGALQRTGAILKMFRNRPYTFADCVGLARLKFEKYFNHKVLFTRPKSNFTQS